MLDQLSYWSTTGIIWLDSIGQYKSPNISVTFQGQESSVLDTFPLDQYQNSCYLFWILEELLRKSKTPCRVDVGSEQMGFLSHLEQHVFLLSDEFPLFSICMWRIGSLLTSSENKMPQSASDQTGPVWGFVFSSLIWTQWFETTDCQTGKML